MAEGQQHYFSHEKLTVYQHSIQMIVWFSDVFELPTKFGDIKDQVERASSSIPLNIAEGNGKFLPKDRCRFFDIVHASALECAAALDVLRARKKLTPAQIHPGKEQLQNIVRMLLGLIKANSTRAYIKDPSQNESLPRS